MTQNILKTCLSFAHSVQTKVTESDWGTSKECYGGFAAANRTKMYNTYTPTTLTTALTMQMKPFATLTTTSVTTGWTYHHGCIVLEAPHAFYSTRGQNNDYSNYVATPYSNTLYRWPYATDSYSTLGSGLATGRASACGWSHAYGGYVPWGLDSGNYSDSCDRFSFATETASACSDFSDRQSHQAGCAY